VPDRPTWAEPLDYANLDPAKAPVLAWHGPGGATAYRVQVASEIFFKPETIVLDRVVKEPRLLLAGLAPDREYFVRVATEAGGRTSAWSAPDAFGLFRADSPGLAERRRLAAFEGEYEHDRRRMISLFREGGFTDGDNPVASATAQASSEYSSDRRAGLAIDWDPNTAWHPRRLERDSWIELDFSGDIPIRRVDILWLLDMAAPEFAIQVPGAREGEWRDVKVFTEKVSAPYGRYDLGQAAKTRRLRIQIRKPAKDTYSAGIAEIRVLP